MVLEQAGMTVVPFDRAQADAAVLAFRRDGKGRHPAGLNLGGLFADAPAKATGEPLLDQGHDFAQTDLPAA